MPAATAPLPTRRSLRARPDSSRSTTRWDVQALRAFAVLAVVLYHLWPHALPGGFVGVDVFFVISGYLITGHLLRELDGTGRIRLARFWSRRALRLLPAAFLAIVATGIAVLVWVPWSLWGQYGRELIASTVYAQNWQLAADSVDYLALGNEPSPFQHFWSLSVEEQFYIALPVLLVAAVAAVRRLLRRGWSAVMVTRVLLGSVAVLSLAWCIIETTTSPGVAYFSTATRAWEFAVGGLASTVVLPAARGALRRVGVWAGPVLLVASLWVVTSAIPFPGAIALVPVVGAGLVVLLGAGTPLEAVGRFAPVRHLGRVSYSVYLWHWPAIVIVPLVTRHELTAVEKVAIGLGAVLVGTASTLLVEEPLRFSRPAKTARPRRVALVGVLASALVLSLGAGTLVQLQVHQTREAEAAQRIESSDPECYGAAARIGSDDPCVNPALADVRVIGGKQDANRGECWSTGDTGFKTCSLGPSEGWKKHLVAIGDSHNNALIDVYEQIARDNDWRIDVAGRASCYFTTAAQQADSDAALAGCNSWKQQAVDWVRAHPDLDGLLVTHSASTRPVLEADGTPDNGAIVDGLVSAWSAATDAGIPVVAIRDNPVPRPDVTTCVQRMTGRTTDECDRSRKQALAAFDGQAEAVARTDGAASLVDLTDLYCTETTCPAVIGGVGVYRDQTHISRSFAATLRPYLERGIERALARSGS